jgi:hypothetical protein
VNSDPAPAPGDWGRPHTALGVGKGQANRKVDGIYLFL